MANQYTQVSITGYNSNPPDDDGSETEANRVKWATIKTKITDPVKTRTDTMDTNIASAFGKIDGGVTSFSTDSSVADTDQGKLVRATASGITITTPDATSVGAPFLFEVLNDTTGEIYFDGHDTQTVNGETVPITVPAGCGFCVRTDGVNWFTAGLNFPRTASPPPVGGYKNLAIKVTGNTGIDVDADAVVLTDGTQFMTVAINSSINMASTGADALDTGSIAQATWYAIWAISKLDGTTAAIASTSFTSPTMPTDYTFKARIGSVRTASSVAQLLGTWQFGRRAQYVVGLAQTAGLPIMGNSTTGSLTAPTWTSISVASFVPSTASKIAITAGNMVGSGGLMAAPNNSYGAVNDLSNPPPLVVNGGGTVLNVRSSAEFLLEGTSIYYANSNGQNSSLQCMGWEDNI